MASVTVTYGKKRSLLRSLGSRRRQKHLAEPLSAKKLGTSARASNGLDFNSAPGHHRSSDPRCHPNAHKHAPKTLELGPSNDIEAIASALLDDTSQYAANVDGGNPATSATHAATISDPISQTTSNQFSGYSPERISIESPHSNGSPKIWHIEHKEDFMEEDQPSRAQALFRAASTRLVANPSRNWKQESSRRPVSHLNGQFLHPSTAEGLKTSSSVPLKSIDIRQEPNHVQQTVKAGLRKDAENIRDKLEAMLAATEALKPNSQDQETPRKARNVGSKVFGRVSNYVWDRFASKSASPGPKAQASTGGSPHLQSEDGWTRARERQDYSNNSDLVRTIEIRLNEGDNLNRDKVRQMVGGKLTRKPVANAGKSLRPFKVTEDPFAEAGEPQLCLGSANKQHVCRDGGLATVPWVLEEYFEGEEGFDDDLDSGILCTVPVGCSTPRTHLARLSGASLEASQIHECSDGSGSPKAAAKVLPLGPCVRLDMVGPRLSAGKTREKRLLSETEAQGGVSLVEAFGQDTSTNDFKRVKKHPSPSKRDLEDLEMAMRRYKIFKRHSVVSECDDEPDELAGICAVPTHRLAPCDGRSMVPSGFPGAGPLQNSTYSLPVLWGGLHEAQACSMPHQRRNSQSKSAAGPRLVVPYKPPISHPHDIDELH